MFPKAEDGFFEYLLELNMKKVKVYSLHEGTIVFPRIPVMRIEGPLGACQILETTILNLCNYASLMVTNATRFRSAAGPGKTLLEFGLRRKSMDKVHDPNRCMKCPSLFNDSLLPRF